ncbi:MAG TPA: hypothetical protein PLD23_21640 [Armatimonadota bacterium]|nr:hypothetical protein [Armatimonadota bacterium]HQK96114.1 hypothetical protein [Armatimonadota bacterium]
MLRRLNTRAFTACLCLSLFGPPLPAVARPLPGPPPVIQDAKDRGVFWEIVPRLRSPDRQTVFHAT